MRIFCFSALFIFAIPILSQEVIVKTDFAVRDFKIKDNSLVYIEKRDIKSVNLETKKPDTLFKGNRFFIGGYGLNIFYLKDTNQIVTSSNELIRNVSSIRFYNLQKKEVNKYEVYYTTELMDFLIATEKKLLFLSKKDSTIEILKYGAKPRYKKTNVITLDSYVRKMIYYKGKLYYITDSGKLFEYFIATNNSKLLYKGSVILTNFVISDSDVFITTISGEIIRFNLDTKRADKIKVSSEIIEAIAPLNNGKIVVGDWSGNIFIVNRDNFQVVEKHKLKKRIIKISSIEPNIFYTSSADFTIRKWIIEKEEQ